MSSYIKEAWEMHISAGERVCLQLAEHEKITSVLGSLRNYKSRSVKAFQGFGMMELAGMLESSTIKFLQSEEGLVVWLEERKPASTGSFIIINSKECDA